MSNKQVTFLYADEAGIPEDLKCAVCLDPFVDPVMHQQCRNVFCSQCIVASGTKCPVCREVADPAHIGTVPRLLVNMLNGLKVICPKCEAKFDRGELSAHLTKCGAAFIAVPEPPSAPPINDYDFPEPVKNFSASNSTTTSSTSPSSTSSTSRQTLTSALVSKGEPKCPNRNNQFHTCSSYCTQRYGNNPTIFAAPPPQVQNIPPPPPPATTIIINTPKENLLSENSKSKSKKDKLKAATNDRKNPNCPNIVNPFHKCTDYCFEHFLTYANYNNINIRSNSNTNNNTGEVNPYCPNASNQFHSCTAYCFERYGPDGIAPPPPSPRSEHHRSSGCKQQ